MQTIIANKREATLKLLSHLKELDREREEKKSDKVPTPEKKINEENRREGDLVINGSGAVTSKNTSEETDSNGGDTNSTSVPLVKIEDSTQEMDVKNSKEDYILKQEPVGKEDVAVTKANSKYKEGDADQEDLKRIEVRRNEVSALSRIYTGQKLRGKIEEGETIK